MRDIFNNNNFSQGQKMNCSNPRHAYLNESITDVDQTASSIIPASAFPKNCQTANAVFLFHANATFFAPPSGNNRQINNVITCLHSGIEWLTYCNLLLQVLSSQIAGASLRGLREPVSHSFSLSARASTKVSLELRVKSCVSAHQNSLSNTFHRAGSVVALLYHHIPGYSVVMTTEIK